MKPNDHKAYAAYCEKFEVRPTLCTYPTMYFISKEGETISMPLTEMYQAVGWSLNPKTNRWSKPKEKDGSKRK